MFTTRRPISSLFSGSLVLGALAAVLAVSGCDRKETILEVDTPDRNVEVERDVDTGSVEVDVTRDK